MSEEQTPYHPESEKCATGIAKRIDAEYLKCVRLMRNLAYRLRIDSRTADGITKDAAADKLDALLKDLGEE